MKIATWNVNSLNVRLPHTLRWLEENQPDILALQELKLEQDKFPETDFTQIGYHAAWNGQKTYNGVAILSRQPLEDVTVDIPELNEPQKRIIAATVNDVRIICAYCVNGEAVDSEKFAYKERWFAALNNYINTELTQYPKTILLGDFNIAPHDTDVYDPVKWQDKVLCSAQERSWFQQLLNLGLTDSLYYLYPDSTNYTWWDYRMNMFKRKLGLRIDHILISNALLPALREVQIDSEARGWERPSDHAPVMATFA
ncbi:exodeoxyribonuclease III [Snodgrassella alvi]|uniref:exodeoxyribonuclease III n=1 Tax=Snodgrassella alvi TaxID=1196083 RepID=UPI0009968917|nr:exodeoxyribonuclease III [Snodgrassella alvi]OOX77958.1 exodeoxyribonuclease III [Snodgrassella alvi]ORF03628.1 exodeoxyribonuclease III [Snodgrassella alvi]